MVQKHLCNDDMLTLAIAAELQRPGRETDEYIIDMIMVERPDWPRDWATDLFNKTVQSVGTISSPRRSAIISASAQSGCKCPACIEERKGAK